MHETRGEKPLTLEDLELKFSGEAEEILRLAADGDGTRLEAIDGYASDAKVLAFAKNQTKLKLLELNSTTTYEMFEAQALVQEAIRRFLDDDSIRLAVQLAEAWIRERELDTYE